MLKHTNKVISFLSNALAALVNSQMIASTFFFNVVTFAAIYVFHKEENVVSVQNPELKRQKTIWEF
jgi:hypothetical protein